MILRLAGGDWNALFGFLGFAIGIFGRRIFPEKRLHFETLL